MDEVIILLRDTIDELAFGGALRRLIAHNTYDVWNHVILSLETPLQTFMSRLLHSSHQHLVVVIILLHKPFFLCSDQASIFCVRRTFPVASIIYGIRCAVRIQDRSLSSQFHARAGFPPILHETTVVAVLDICFFLCETS